MLTDSAPSACRQLPRALALFTGGLTAHHNMIAIVATAAAFLAGMLVCLGTAAGDIGTISLVTLVIFSSRPLTPQQAAISRLVALGGALLQTSLALLLRPPHRGDNNRGALGRCFKMPALTVELLKRGYYDVVS